MFRYRLAFVLCVPMLFSGCIGSIRETTTERTATEQLLLSTAAERAIGQFDQAKPLLARRRVAIDTSMFESYDDAYVISALRDYLSRNGALIVPLEGSPEATALEAAGRKPPVPDRIVEVRSGGIGIKDASWGIGVPPFPLPIPNTAISTATPPLYLFYKGKQEGWAKLQLWIYDPRRMTYVAGSKDLWGRSYSTQWWLFFLGPFDFSNDIYPGEDEFSIEEEQEVEASQRRAEGDKAATSARTRPAAAPARPAPKRAPKKAASP